METTSTGALDETNINEKYENRRIGWNSKIEAQEINERKTYLRKHQNILRKDFNTNQTKQVQNLENIQNSKCRNDKKSSKNKKNGNSTQHWQLI